MNIKKDLRIVTIAIIMLIMLIVFNLIFFSVAVISSNKQIANLQNKQNEIFNKITSIEDNITNIKNTLNSYEIVQ